jgi:hypothetical protein
MVVMQMKYYPKEVYYEVREGVNYIILDYGDSKVEHVIAAQQGVQRIGWSRCLFCGATGEYDHKHDCPNKPANR